jgi:uncharacterized protein (DUF111 family)
LSHAGQRLMAAGALDVWIEPVIMKKGRPGIVLHALVTPDQQDRILPLFFEETSTFGVRIEGPFQRQILARRQVPVDLGYGTIEVKVGSWNDRIVQASPEYETVAALSAATGKPVKHIYEDVVARMAAIGEVEAHE